MKKFLPIIIAVVVSVVASSGVTYLVTVNSMKGETAGVTDTAEGTGTGKTPLGAESNLNAEGEGYELMGGQETVSGTAAENKITIKSAEIVKTKEGKDAVIVTYGYTRLQGEAESFGGNYFDENVYQNGVALEELGKSSFTGDVLEKYDFAAEWNDVKAGYSTDVQIPYLVGDSETDLVVELIDELPKNSGEYIVTRTFELK